MIGEIGLLAISPEDLIRSTDEVDALIAEAINSGVGPLSMALPAGKRSATCAALDHVELAVIQRADFLEMIRGYPRVRRALVECRSAGSRPMATISRDTRVFVEQGLLSGTEPSGPGPEQLHPLRRMHPRLRAAARRRITRRSDHAASPRRAALRRLPRRHILPKL